MGLDSFTSDEDENQTSSDEEEHDNEEQQEDELSGIEAFRTSETDPSKKENKEGDDEDEYLFGLKPWRWNQMDKDEKVKHVRENFVEDYHPDYQPDERWQYARIVEVKCVCDNVFTFQTTGICLDCGRAYKDAGRTVIKTKEIEDNNNNA